MRSAEVRVYEDAAGEFRWRLVGRNGRILADSAEGYTSRFGAKRAARNLLRTIAGPIVLRGEYDL